MRSDFRDNTDTINKMIQFGTVKYGIVKQLKDRSRSERDVNSDHEENGSSIPCSPVVACKSASPELHQTIFDHPTEDHHNNHHHNNNINENHVNHHHFPIHVPIKAELPETYPQVELNHKLPSPPIDRPRSPQKQNEVQNMSDGEVDGDGEDDRESNHSNNQITQIEEQNQNKSDEQHQENPNSNEHNSPPPLLPQFPAAPVTLEAIQNMQMAIAQFAAKTLANGGADNEAAMKQLAFLQQTLFNLQQQQLFQIQLIQQLQSQLAMNQLKEDQENNEDDECDEEEQICAENLSNQKSEEEEEEEENQKTETENESMEVVNHDEEELDHQRIKEEPREEPRTIDENRIIQNDLPLPLPKQDENTPLPYGSDLASSIITNHDNPPSLDEPNSLEMLQKRAQEVLDSASQGILAGNLADEFAFGKDKSGDGKNRNEPFFKHRCRYCGKVFGSDSALQIHIRSHTGERPFKCNVCGSRFTTKGNLKVHFQRHAQKFPHVPMNSTPIPEHLDKFHPPLLEQMSPEESPQHQPQMPHPNVPVSLPLPFPPGAGFPGLPLYRPPLEILKSLGPYPNPFFGALPPMQPKRDQEMPTDLRKPPPASSPKLNEEPKEEPLSLRIKEEREIEPEPPRPKSTTPPPPPQPPVSMPLQHIPEFPPTITHLPPSIHRDELQDRLPLNYAKPSPERRSPIRSPASIPRSPFLGPIKHEMTLLPRPHSNDNSWENFIEVSNTSETVKLKELMKNKKITDPNQCVVCDRVLSCKSALQMHYRTHTGERPFKCRICGRAFTTKGNLKTHMAVHKIRPPMRNFHQCPVCHKKYSNALVLQQHIRLHTGEPTDLTPEQIQAAEIRDFPPSMMPGSLFNPFAFNFGINRPNGTIGSESSQGENDENMDCSDDFEDDISDHLSNGGDFDRPKSGDDMKGMLFEQKLKIENSRPKSEASSSAPTSPISVMNKSSPAPSDTSQGALDLTPRSVMPPHNPPFLPSRPPFGMFPNLPLFPPVSTTTQNMCNAMNSIAQSVMPSAPFNPLALSGVRGSTTCGICFKTFPCHSALEIHYRSHTKERPFKCSICDRGFTTKGNLKQHMLTHKIRDMEQDAFRNRAVK